MAEREGGWKDRPPELLPPPAVPSSLSSSLAPGRGIPNLGTKTGDEDRGQARRRVRRKVRRGRRGRRRGRKRKEEERAIHTLVHTFIAQ